MKVICYNESVVNMKHKHNPFSKAKLGACVTMAGLDSTPTNHFSTEEDPLDLAGPEMLDNLWVVIWYTRRCDALVAHRPG